MTFESENSRRKGELEKVRLERDKYKRLFDVSADYISKTISEDSQVFQWTLSKASRYARLVQLLIRV